MPSVLFQKLVKERRWTSYETFLRHFEGAARNLAGSQGPASLGTVTIGKRQFLRWLGGEMKGSPRQDVGRVLEYLFQVPVEELFQPLQDAQAGSRTPVAGTAPYDAPASGGCVSEDVVMAAAHDSARFAADAERSNVGPHTLEQLDADIRRIVATYPNRPVGPVFLEVKELRDRTFDLLEGRQPPQYTRDLYLAAGVLCGILANASFDLGRYDAAETQARAGFLCGELAGHHGLRAWLRGLQALIAYWDGRPQDAVRLAVSGRDFHPEQGTPHIRLASIEARAHGRLNRTGDALAALRRADALRDQAEGEDIPGGMMAFPLAKQLFYESTTHLWLGGAQHLSRAEDRAREAVRMFEADPPEQRRLGELSLARMDLALARLGGDDLEGAADQVHTVLAVASRRRTDSVATRLEQFGRRLALHPAGTSPLAVNVTEAIMAHRSQDRAVALPPGADR